MFTHSIEEAQIWFRLLAILCEMNQKSIDVLQVNPFDYDRVNRKLREEKSAPLPSHRLSTQQQRREASNLH